MHVEDIRKIRDQALEKLQKDSDNRVLSECTRIQSLAIAKAETGLSNLSIDFNKALFPQEETRVIHHFQELGYKAGPNGQHTGICLEW